MKNNFIIAIKDLILGAIMGNPAHKPHVDHLGSGTNRQTKLFGKTR